jgi:glycosyltransferase involved in cell wall biosynthesis
LSADVLAAPAAPARAPAVPRRIRVVHLIHTMAYGGVETALLNWVRGFDRERFDIRVVCFANPGATEQPFVDAAARQGVSVAKIPWARRKPLLRAARALAGLLRQTDADILHCHGWYADYVGAITGRLVDVRTITTQYVWHDYDWKRNLIQRVNQYVIRLFDRVTAHCEATRQKTIERGFAPESVRTLICGFETHPVDLSAGERSRLRRQAGVADEDLLLVNVARLYPEKAQDALLRCFARIRLREPRARLWIAGVGPLEAELKAMCTRLGLDDSVSFIGFTTELPRVLALADLQVHPAHIEGVPLAVCEGMAAGLPIVASRVGGLPEVLDNGASGILVPEGDEDAFAEAVLALMRDRPRAAALGTAARAFIENDYSLATAVRAVEATYDEMVARCA